MRALLWAIAAIVVGLALFEVTMQPTAADRAQLAVIFTVTAAVGLLATTILPRLARRWTAIRFTVVGVAITSFLIAATGLIVAAEQMFISGHDLTLLLVVLGFAFVASVGFAVAVAGPLMWDLDRVANAADRVGEGDLTVRSGVRRGDEIGRVAGAFDAMTDALEDAADQRTLDEESRRRFFAAVGHDLRTPLASLLAAIEALEDGVAPDPARYLHSMERDVAALSALVDDLFLLSRIDSGSISIASEPVDVTELADEAIEVLRPVANRAGVTLRLEADRRTVVPGGNRGREPGAAEPDRERYPACASRKRGRRRGSQRHGSHRAGPGSGAGFRSGVHRLRLRPVHPRRRREEPGYRGLRSRPGDRPWLRRCSRRRDLGRTGTGRKGRVPPPGRLINPPRHTTP
jgi:signal transduction histidine kinase